MKKILYTIVILTAVSGCDIFDGQKTLISAQPVEPLISNEELVHYQKLLGDYFDSRLPDKVFNGAILVAKKGQIIYEKYTGNKALKTGDPVSDSTSFHLASTTKTFTSIAILQLVQHKKLSLNDSLNSFFPGIPYQGITIKMLLNHHSGLPDYLNYISNSDWDKSKNVTNNDVVSLLYSLRPRPEYPPGKRFNYCNTNYVLLAAILEKVTGKSYPDYINTNFFRPLKMYDSYVYTPADSVNALLSFNYDNSLWRNDFLEMTYGDKNIYASARDMLKWDQALYTDQLISQALLDSAFTPYILTGKNLTPALHNYGLGFRLKITPAGKKVIYHFGRWHGFNVAFSRLPDEEIAIIILGNKFTRNIYTAASSLYEIFGNYNPGKNKVEEPDNELVSWQKELPASKHSYTSAPARTNSEK